MAKQNNSLTELQALVGIYEHLSTIDDLAKEVGMISTRLRKIEEQLKEPVNITDPILAQDLTRDTCIYGALAKSMEACREVKEQKKGLDGIMVAIQPLKTLCNSVEEFRGILTDVREDIEDIYATFKFIILMIAIVFGVMMALLIIIMMRLN